MAGKKDELFSQGSLTLFLSRCEGDLSKRISSIDRRELASRPMEDWCDEILGEIRLKPVRLRENEKRVSARNIDISAGAEIAILPGGGAQTDAVEVKIEVPFEGDAILLELRPPMAPAKNAPFALVKSDHLEFSYVVRPEEVDDIETMFELDLGVTGEYLKRQQVEVEEFNRSMDDRVRKSLKTRHPRTSGRGRLLESISVSSPVVPPKASPIRAGLEEGVVTFRPGVIGGFEQEVDSKPGEREELEQAMVSIPRETGTQIKYIVDLDLCGYSDIARDLERSQGVESVQELNKQIKGFIVQALEDVGMKMEELPLIGTGDGAILAFDSAITAASFAVAVHDATDRYNQGENLAITRRDFRVGVCKGKVVLEPVYTPGGDLMQVNMAGTPISSAVRLENACRAGEVLICDQTYEELPADMRAQYGARETVKGKREETFQAHRRGSTEPATGDC